MEDLDHAIEANNEVVKITPANHFERGLHSYSFGRYLYLRSERTSPKEDRLHSISAFEEAWSCSNAPPSRRIRAARFTAVLRAEDSKLGKVKHPYSKE